LKITKLSHPKVWEWNERLRESPILELEVDEDEFQKYFSNAKKLFPYFGASLVDRESIACHIAITHAGFHGLPVPPCENPSVLKMERLPEPKKSKVPLYLNIAAVILLLIIALTLLAPKGHSEPPNEFNVAASTYRLPQGVVFPPLQFQNAGVVLGNPFVVNCSTGTTCSISGSILTLTAAGGVGGTPCVTTALSLQFNSAGAFGCVAEFTYASPTISASATGVLDLSAGPTLTGFKIPSAAGAVPTVDGILAENTTNHTHVWGSNGTTMVGAIAAIGTGTATTCTNQAVTVISSLAIPTCTTITSAYTSGTFPATAHNLLSATHGDTTSSAAVRGGGIFALGASPTWTQVAHSAATGGYFKWNGTDVVASTGAAAGTGNCTNQFVRNENADAGPTCNTVALASDVSGQLPIGNVGSAGLSGTSPVTISAAGAIGCATCVTSSGGGAMTGTAPIAVSAAGAISVSGAAGQIPNGATGAFTATPSLGTDASAAGTLTLANGAGGGAHTIWSSGATTTNTIAGFAAVPTTTDLITCVVASTTCTLTDSGIAVASNKIAISAVGTAGLSGTAPVTISAAGAIGCATCQLTSGTIPINQVVSATGAIATIADGNNPLVINCALTSGTTCLTTGETTAASTAGAVEHQITTLTTTTAIPLQITQGANGPAAANAPAVLNVSAASAGGIAAATGGGFVGAPIGLKTGAGSAAGATSGTGGTGGAYTFTTGAGGAGSSTTGNGGVGGAFNLTTGAGGAAGASTLNTGGAGGAILMTTGAGTAGAATGAGAAGGSYTFTGGIGGAGGATSGLGGAGGSINLTAGAGGAATAGSTTGAGGNIVLTPGAAGGTGTAGLIGVVQVAGANAGFTYMAQGATNTTANTNIPANSIIDQAPAAVTAYTDTRPGVAPVIASYKQTNGCASAICTEAFHPVPVLLTVANDFTDSTSTTLQLITGLSTTMPVSQAVVVSFHCAFLFDQGTATVADAFGIGITGTAPTSANASGSSFISTSTITTGTLTSLASTTPTAVVTFTPSAITTIWRVVMDGTVEQPSNATPGVLGFYVSTTTGADNVIVKRGSYCSVIYQ
jgi:hypothetical protein